MPGNEGLQIQVVVPCYNAAPWIGRCLESIARQTHRNLRCVVIDDASTDGTSDVIRGLGLDERFVALRNATNRGPLANTHLGFATLASEGDARAVCTIVDGDDWLGRPDALAIIAGAYAADPGLLMTYGNLSRSTSPDEGIGREPPKDGLRPGKFRSHTFPVLSPRTFRRELWSRIRESDLRDPETGDFWRVSGDVAFIAPLIEMAGGRVKFIPEVLYVYNQDNPLSDFRMRRREQTETARRILKLSSYAPILPRR